MQVRALAERAHVCIDGATIIEPTAVLKDAPTPWAERMVEALYTARKAKGMTREQARELLRKDEAYFGDIP